MHSAEAQHADGSVAVSQSEADSCCAASEQDDATKSPAAFVPIISLAVVAAPVPVVVPQTAARTDAWRVFVPLPGAHVPRHLFLSVFLI